MKKFRLIYLALPLLLLIVSSCEITIVAPEPNFTATVSASGDDYVDVSFSDLSSPMATSWNWTFEGGYPETSELKNPKITYDKPGTYSVTLVATNSGGGDEITKHDFVNIVEFVNPTYKEIDITVENNTKTIELDESVLFGVIDKTTVPYYAKTYGQTSDGTVIGLELEWDNSVDLSEFTLYNLNVSSEYFFLYMTNYGSGSLSPIYVGYDSPSNSKDKTENIVIPNDNKKYGIGYYDAEEGVDVWADRKDSDGTLYWNNIDLPYLLNQSYECYTDDSKSGTTKKSTSILKPAKMVVATPEKKSKKSFNKNAHNIYATVKE
ncbi:MAG: PKD domain-containing protein [Bacteroidetes bacterium]|nr:PKD domain-containing protein [Bacteroidota bacterium]